MVTVCQAFSKSSGMIALQGLHLDCTWLYGSAGAYIGTAIVPQLEQQINKCIVNTQMSNSYCEAPTCWPIAWSHAGRACASPKTTDNTKPLDRKKHTADVMSNTKQLDSDRALLHPVSQVMTCHGPTHHVQGLYWHPTDCHATAHTLFC